MPEKQIIDICICTFRRSHIVETLRSVAAIDTREEWDVRVIVADNDEDPSAKECVEESGREMPFPLTYLHAPARNISIARNACLKASRQEIIVFIDDDELVKKGWLKALVTRYEETKAAAVIGPVKAIYDAQCPAWVRKGDYHSREAVYVNGEIVTGYTANILFNARTQYFKGREFRLELGQSGGEDSAFLKAAWQEGAKIEYAPEAIATEVVPEERTKFMFLARRKFREGQTHGMMLYEEQGKGILPQLKRIMLAKAKALFCFAAAPLFLLKRHRFNYWVFRGCLHIGVVSYFLGKQTLILYGLKSE